MSDFLFIVLLLLGFLISVVSILMVTSGNVEALIRIITTAIIVRTIYYGLIMTFILVPFPRPSGITHLLAYKYGFDAICAGMLLGLIIPAVVSNTSLEKLNKGLERAPRRLISVLSLTLSITFIVSASGAIKNFSRWLVFFKSCGYNKEFLIFIILVEMLGGIGLLFRQSRIFAMLLLMADMAGATITHFHNYFSRGTPDPLGNSLPSLSMLVLLFSLFILLRRTGRTRAIGPKSLL